MTFVPQKPQRGVLHEYGPNLTAFEFTKDSEQAPNVVLFIGGLTNGLLNVPYVIPLAEEVSRLEGKDGKWVVVQALISASYSGWGTSSLKKDASELSRLVKYLRSDVGGNRKKVVLLGHSTGSQDTMQYLSKLSHEADFDNLSEIDGGILQASVSDAEAVQQDPHHEKLVKEVYDEYIAEGKADHVLPEKFRKFSFGTPITAYRFHSLYSKRGDDDFFSSYLGPEDFKKTFSKVKKPLLVLYGSKDPFVPKTVDKEKLLARWKDATDPNYWSPLSKIIPGAVHDIGAGSDEGAQADFIGTVVKFIATI